MATTTEDKFARADRRIAEAKDRVFRQAIRVEVLFAKGHETDEAERLLMNMLRGLELMERYRMLI